MLNREQIDITLMARVRETVNRILSVPFVPGMDFQALGGFDSGGWMSSAKVISEKVWSRRIRKYDISLYANCTEHELPVNRETGYAPVDPDKFLDLH
jgi:hypothetical protein